MRLSHFKELDGVRAVAALMIMFFHFFQTLNTQNIVWITVKKYAFFGQTGVSLFFVLSGFLITRILLNTKESSAYFKNFYVRRALRIFPLYFGFLLIFYFLIPILQKSIIVPFTQQIWYWVYLQNFAMTFNWKYSGPGHFWSLAVEEHFYLFWPLVIYFFGSKKITIAIVLIIATAFFTRLVMLKNGVEVFYFTFSRMDELGAGALLAILEIKGKLISGYSKKFGLLFLVCIVPTLTLWTFTSGLGIELIQAIKFTLLGCCYFSLIGLIITIRENHWLKKILKLKYLSFTGKISYGLYVYHPLCFYLISNYITIESVLLSFTLSFAFCYLTAGLSFYLFESKFLLLKNKFAFKSDRMPVIN